MSNTTIARPVSGDAVSWPSKYGTIKGWLVRYIITGDTHFPQQALVEMRRGGLIHVAADELTKDAP